MSQIKIDSGGFNGSRWGLRGTEDLGGGLKANFRLESGFNADTGSSAQGGLLFGRQAYVGLSGGFGAVKLGRNYTAYDDIRGSIVEGIVFDSAFSPIGDVFDVGGDYASRVDNSFHYATPNFGGFSGGFSYSLGEDKSETPSVSASSNVALNLTYANGPISVGFGHQTEKTQDFSGATPPVLLGTTSSNKYNFIGGAYDFGFAKLTAAFNTRKLGNDEDQEVAVGVQVPFGAVTLGAGYAQSQNEVGGIDGEKGTGFGLAATYDLSKRTTFYAGLKSTKVELNNVDTNKSNLVAVGVRHRF